MTTIFSSLRRGMSCCAENCLRIGRIPQRTHFYGGGFPLIGDPEDAGFNQIVVLLTLVLRTIPGIKWLGILAMCAGALSVYALARMVFRLQRFPAFAGAAFYGLSSWLPVRMEDGNPNEAYCYLLPTCVLCLALLGFRKQYLIALMAVFALTLTDGKFTLIADAMFLTMLCGLHVIAPAGLWGDPAASRMERLHCMKFLGLALLSTGILMAFRILPSIDLFGGLSGMSHMNLTLNDTHHYKPLSSMTYGLRRFAIQLVDWGGVYYWKNHKPIWIFVGWVPLILALVACFVKWSRAWPWVLMGAIFVWLSMADRAPIDLFAVFSNIPVFNSVTRPAKYFGPPIILCISVLAAYGMDFILTKMGQARFRNAVALAILVLGIVPLHRHVWASSEHSYDYILPAAHPFPASNDGVFFQVKSRDLPIDRVLPVEALAYANLLRGVGTIDWYTGVEYPSYAVPKYYVERNGAYTFNPEYRGECFWLDSGEQLRCSFSPHKITVYANTTRPRTLVVNQNFHPDWHSRVGNLVARQGLIAVEVPSGADVIELTYRSRAFVLGLWVSITALTAITLLIVLHRRVRDHWKNSEQKVKRYTGLILDWLLT